MKTHEFIGVQKFNACAQTLDRTICQNTETAVHQCDPGVMNM